MNKPFIRPKRRKITKLDEAFNDITGQEEITKLIDIDKLVSNDNPYPLSEMEDLIESIKQFGLEQSLLVQEQEDDTYLIVAGHRRYNAIKTILETDDTEEYDELTQVYCRIISKDEDPILVRIRLHDTNLQSRPLLKMSDEEKINIVEEYTELLNTARKNKILINGKKVTGRTRDILAERFNISPRTAQDLITASKNPPAPESPSEDKPIDPSEKEYISITKKITSLENSIEKATYLNELQKEEIFSKIQLLLERIDQ